MTCIAGVWQAGRGGVRGGLLRCMCAVRTRQVAAEGGGWGRCRGGGGARLGVFGGGEGTAGLPEQHTAPLRFSSPPPPALIGASSRCTNRNRGWLCPRRAASQSALLAIPRRPPPPPAWRVAPPPSCLLWSRPRAAGSALTSCHVALPTAAHNRPRGGRGWLLPSALPCQGGCWGGYIRLAPVHGGRGHCQANPA